MKYNEKMENIVICFVREQRLNVARLRELTGLESNHLDYYLKKLLKGNVIKKVDKDLYQMHSPGNYLHMLNDNN